MAGTRSIRALVALLAVTIIWGWTFSWMKQAIVAADGALGPGGTLAGISLYMFLRFGLAACVLLAVPAARRGWSGAVVRGGGALGGILLAGFLLQMWGLGGVSPSVSAFLTSLYVVFTAFITTWRGTHRVSPALLVGVALATFGAGFIDGPPQLTFGLAEGLTICSAFVFAVHILLTDSVTRRVAVLPATAVSFVAVAAGSAVTLGVSLISPGAPDVHAVARLAALPAFWVPMLLAAILATVVALTLMNLYQRDLDPVRAAVLYALEPVWASIVASYLGLADASAWLWIGGASLLLGNLVAEIGAAKAPASTRGETAL